MKHKFVFSVVLATAFSLVGCSSNPVPLGLGNEMTYQSSDRPDWTSEAFYIKDGYGYAIGLSNRMSTEKSSKESALTNAMGNLAAGIQSSASKDNYEALTVTDADESKVNHAKNNSVYTSKLSAKEIIYQPIVESGYFEIWKNKRENEQFFKYYVLVKTKL